jgi:hypothetical protein
LRGAATGFAEGLAAPDAEILASYRHPHLGRWAAVTTKAAGAGHITVVGTVPDQNLAAALVRWLAPRGVDGWITSDSVTVSTSTDTEGTRLHVLHNWSWEEMTATPSSALTDVLGGGRHKPGEPSRSGRGTSVCSAAMKRRTIGVRGRDREAVKSVLSGHEIELRSWAFGNSGTRLRRSRACRSTDR